MIEEPEPIDTRPDPDPSSTYQPQWSQWTRRTVSIIMLIGAIYAISLIGPVAQMLTIAFLLAFVMYIPSRALAEHTPLSFSLSVVLLYLVLILIALFLLLVFIPAFVSWVNGLIDNVEAAYADLQARLEAYRPEDGILAVFNFEVDLNFIIMPVRQFVLGAREATESPGEDLAPGPAGEAEAPPAELTSDGGELFDSGDILQAVDLRQFIDGLVNVAGLITRTLTSAITSVAGAAITMTMALFVSFLVLLELPRAQKAVPTWIPPAYQREYSLLVSEIVRVWNAFFKGQLTIGFIIGALTWVQLVVMGVPGAEILAVFTGAISLIPTLGGLVALVPLGLVPLLQGSSVFTEMSNGAFALLVVGVSLLIQQIVWNAVAPKILGDALDLPLPVIVVGVFIGAAIGGILGAFLVAPIMGTIRVIVVYLFKKISQQDPFPGRTAPAFPPEAFARLKGGEEGIKERPEPAPEVGET